jgi:hypothetical protein
MVALAGQAVEEDTHQAHQALQLQGKVLLEELAAQAGLHLMPLAVVVQLQLVVMVEQTQVTVVRVAMLTLLGLRQHQLERLDITLVVAAAQWRLVALMVLAVQVVEALAEPIQERLAR